MSCTHDLLVNQQVRIAYSEFAKLVDAVIANTDIAQNPIKVILFNESRPIGIYDIFDKDGLYFVQNGMSQVPIYYDIKTEMYRVKNYYLDYDFTFIDDGIEHNRQILEIIQSLYVHKYMGATKEYLTVMVKKLEAMTEAPIIQNEGEVIFGSFYGPSDVPSNLIDF